MASKMIALFLALGLAASVTACGGDSKTETGGDSAPATEETVETGEDIPEDTKETQEKSK